MKIEESKDFDEVEIIIRCSEIDDQLAGLIRQINQMAMTFTGKLEGRIHSIDLHDVLYIETVDNQTFLCTSTDVFESDLKLYTFEERLKETHFLRISKHLIVNMKQIESVRALLNGKFEALLDTGEKVIVNRHYAKSFREYFLRGGDH
ncbi:LytTR family DNA-binding domain-containing protein [Sporosarcina oncorhynchi]|uniref:LytTR family DNA-binding domain-containing protein n=1 Tax=Sporosarcina oncorhynchi TaxID=3056444 RepID=A0ABZ0L5B7_9BACL|nr:LytTR family DNA-binding domain-containing protein [Sporosarcina sp. T2O-4]WOV86847.1 LytTR family DNA-binding domain-containing protein [Sporosarcina sp. T2O-4]